MATDDTTPTVHRALASPARARLVELLRGTRAPLTIDALAEELGLHPNTVRTHLAVLEDAGLVASSPEARDRPGRPRLAYRATAAAPGDGARGYRVLAEVLTSHLAATAPDPAASGRDAGRAWGRDLVDRPDPSTPVTPDDGIARVVALLDEFGFAPQLDGTDPAHPRVRLHRCPFLDVAKDHQDVVCSIHLGLVRGALDQLGVAVEATALLPFVEPDLCIAELEVGS